MQFARNHRRVLVGLAGLAVLLVGASGNAEPPYSRPWSPPYGVSLEDENGSALRAFRHDGETFVHGYMGERYRVRIANHSDERVEAVLSIDGRDAVSGRVGDYGDQRGYIVPAHGSVVVDGFRQSLDRVAKFRFSDPSSSYSSRMGTPENVGVIGVAFFRERAWPRRAVRIPREDPWNFGRHAERDQYDAPARRAPAGASPSPSAPRAGDSSAPRRDETQASKRSSSSAAEATPSGRYRYDGPWRHEYRDDDEQRLGTEYGESGWSPVSEVPFRRQNPEHPDSVVTLRYDDADGLRARGIDVRPRPVVWQSDWSRWYDYDSRRHPRWDASTVPEPFPGSRFAPPPP